MINIINELLRKKIKSIKQCLKVLNSANNIQKVIKNVLFYVVLIIIIITAENRGTKLAFGLILLIYSIKFIYVLYTKWSFIKSIYDIAYMKVEDGSFFRSTKKVDVEEVNK